MLSTKELRKFEVWYNNQWVPCRMDQLEPGDLFRIFEHTGEPVQYGDEREFVCTQMPNVQHELPKKKIC